MTLYDDDDDEREELNRAILGCGQMWTLERTLFYR